MRFCWWCWFIGFVVAAQGCAFTFSPVSPEQRAEAAGRSAAAIYALRADPASTAKAAKVLDAVDKALSLDLSTPESVRASVTVVVEAVEPDEAKRRKLLQALAAAEGGVIAVMGDSPTAKEPEALARWRVLMRAAIKGARSAL